MTGDSSLFLPYVVKRFADGSEVAYVVMRGSPCLKQPCDGRYDSRLGELLLDDSTVSGYAAGEVRFMTNTFFPTDEQPNLAMAGDQLLAGHWEAGIAHQVLERGPALGSSTTPIGVAVLPHIATSQGTDVCNSGFRAGHDCAQGLSNTRQWPGGFYIYWQQRAVCDQYWSEYATWVVSGDTVYFVSTDGAVVALTHGEPAVSVHQPGPAAPVRTPPGRAGRIDYTAARQYAGRTATVEGVLHAVFDNGKAVYLTFQTPHQGAFLARIPARTWSNFTAHPATLYAPGQRVQITGLIEWYQGDPVIEVTQPAQIRLGHQANPPAATDYALYLPSVGQPPAPSVTPSRTPTPTQMPTVTLPAAALPRVNAPSFTGPVPFEQMAIFWFGTLSASSNYAIAKHQSTPRNTAADYTRSAAYEAAAGHPTSACGGAGDVAGAAGVGQRSASGAVRAATVNHRPHKNDTRHLQDAAGIC